MTVSSAHRRIAKLFAIAAMLVIAACSSRPADEPPLGRVRGKVTMDGKPLAGVDVVFLPEKGRPSLGSTDAAGHYDLWYVNRTMGAKVGPHKVFVRPTEMPPEEAAANGSSSGAPGALPPKIPAKYTKRSTLAAEVKPGRNTFDFALESK
jgi:hypothetical protein